MKYRKHDALGLIICLFIALTSCKTNGQEMKIDNSTVTNINLERYTGTWYEIARFNHRFEQGLVGVTATYTLLPNGKIRVINAGYKGSLSGAFTSAKAKAKVKAPGHLKVFFIPFFGANYYVMELDENYEWALVGSSSANYLWILSRTPKLESNTLNNIIDLAAKRGYDVSKLLMVKQKEN